MNGEDPKNKDTRVTRAPLEMATIEELRLQTQTMDQFYKNLMVEGTDYGVIPGTKKPTLLKPGAELLRIWADLTPEFEIDNTGTDLERGLFAYQVDCSLYNKENRLIGQGVGYCSSLEAKYRYRWLGDRELPPGIDKSSLVFKEKTSRTGGKWRVYRMENDNPQDQANTVLKISKKRAFVDAILTVTGASRIFTQDIEDMAETISSSGDMKPPVPEAQEKRKVKPKADTGKKEKATDSSPLEGEDKAPGESEEGLGQEAGTAIEEIGQKYSEKLDEQERDIKAIKSLADMYKACFDDFGMQPDKVMAELNVKSNIEIKETPAECYARIASVMKHE